ncbi:ribonuclease HII [Aureimonas phyllosphaerae]|uniref:Ribonuclease HII n=1 Tax=Aureimonas phyllosphaerae TaxID=1166078 RepID=A0A7W6BLS8_9HYPH|nr:ribonuclease HII [Aureimonas phyllosphaerae]MBB3934324.1 ribonuclease HII [Aureimonas phyllosphaerae]MBB3958460.1 ribonuclease HII [Aureimonas phyllosphaerae]SFE97466.1 RNase HII [Aureimonas phyllosphaerae]
MREVRRTMTRRSSDPSLPTLFAPGLVLPRSDEPGPNDAIERHLLTLGHQRIAGVDEAGRGPLAGPVVAAAVILDFERLPEGLDDSKKLKAHERERLYDEILLCAEVGVGTAGASEIDHINIRQATLNAMRRALAGLATAPGHALVDGRDVPPRLACPATAVIGGDARSLSIAAASIVAKVTRDRMMATLCGTHPAYGFGRHMGYGTAAHLEAIEAVGPCVHHRRSFAPVAARLARAE